MREFAFMLWGFLFIACFIGALLYGALSADTETAQWQAATIVWFFGIGALTLKLFMIPVPITIGIWAVFWFWVMLIPLMWIINQGIKHRRENANVNNIH